MDRCYMTQDTYRIGKILNELTKRDVNYPSEEVINLLCINFYEYILSLNDYYLIPEQITMLKQLIQNLRR